MHAPFHLHAMQHSFFFCFFLSNKLRMRRCRFGMFLTFAFGALAVVLMWLLWPREAEYVKPMIASINFLQVRNDQFFQIICVLFGWVFFFFFLPFSCVVESAAAARLAQCVSRLRLPLSVF
jgi:hypothetical protein